MAHALLGTKLGMTRWFMEDGTNVPVTVIQAGPCVVTQVKTTDTEGYDAVQIGYDDIKPRRSTMPLIGHDHKAGSGPLRTHREIRGEADVELGDRIDVSVFEGVMFVDVLGRSKGKGFQGGMKRHHFRGLEASHGVKRRHRSPGSINGHATNLGTGPKIKKGKRMAGHMGDVNVTNRSMQVISIDPEKNLIMVKGTVPGPVGASVMVRAAVRINKQKARVAKAG
ncbi:MAG: 50S ribosomal protein L3 [Phycisphaerales bacterium]|jgi:large subunit ribosomal protein L3|nr:50S ribosomal protein L3 [Phycisphaerales bacterium]MDP6311219.1 50S ribosomal protein L3 [Phycisphaerales bacterium]MDP7086378.1 50S ribosomal protein L3 [Phycisphaerales bacterium]MDP7189336.1 50S ribosomal protein L3 [Phycisphaerales bacterium]MDP7519988.1 50S ribosomal protein L3 [Phycisphaerales bacterium]|tara:strand:+ start:680 stop:1351 length:672 start_codon:yes stop_codon:yes gene_type:complete